MEGKEGQREGRGGWGEDVKEEVKRGPGEGRDRG